MARTSRPLKNVVPYPRDVRVLPGRTVLSSSTAIELPDSSDTKERLAAEMLRKHLRGDHGTVDGPAIRICSLAMADRSWLTDEQATFLSTAASDQAYVLSVTKKGVLVAGKTPIGALYGTQTLLQLIQKRSGGTDRYQIQNVEIRDQPAVERRSLSIAMSWYAGYGRIGFASQLWGRDQWMWFVDWCLRHKINNVNLCMYGYYPFRFEEYPESVFKNVEMRTWLSETGAETTVRYTHPNVLEEFLPDVIRYANERGITVLCYFGLNTFNGGYSLAHPESRYRSDDPAKFRQFRYNLCPSRKDVRDYLDSSVRRLLDIGFNGIVLEESEGSGFCECQTCMSTYYGKGGDSRSALHEADYELFNRLYSIVKKERPDATVGIRMWRMGSEVGVEALREGKKRIPADVLVFWSNGMDATLFKGWVGVFGPDRIVGEDAEALGFSTLYDGLVYMLPRQYSSYVDFVDPGYKPLYPQSLPGDIKQYRMAADLGCGGVTGFAFNWNGWEMAPLCLAQYGWNPDAFALDEFLEYGYTRQFGESGRVVAKAMSILPIVLETRICEGSKVVPRDDPVSGGLAGLTSLQVPTKFGEGEAEEKALREDLWRARRALRLLQSMDGGAGMEEQDRITLRYMRNAALRTVYICRAALEYRKALLLEREKRAPSLIASHLSKSLHWTKEDYRIVRESAFDLTEEFHQRIIDAIETISSRLERWRPQERVRSSGGQTS